MSERLGTTIITYGLLGLAVGVTLLMPDRLAVPASQAQGAPDTIALSGTVRDFQSAHADFDLSPAGGFGHCAGNVLVDLGAGGLPVLDSGGDDNGPFDNRIVHWKFDDGSGFTALDEMGENPGTLEGGPAWVAGNDGGALDFDGIDDYVEIPSSPEMQVGGDISFAAWFKLDANFGPSSPKTLVIMEKFLDTEHDFHVALVGLDYNRAEVAKGSLVFKVENGPTTEYFRYKWTNQTSWTAGTWYHFAAVLTSSDTAQNKLLVNGIDDTSATDAGGVGFVDTSYDAPMRVGGRTIDFNGVATDMFFAGLIDDVTIFDRALTPGDYGTPLGGYEVAAEWYDSAGRPIAPHLCATASAGAIDSCANPLADIEGARGADSQGDITSGETFAEWFGDVLGTNLSSRHEITLTRNGSAYEYIDDAFHPIDDQAFGNEGAAHNHHLTYTIAASFAYDACAEQFLEFEGGDGAWVFVNRVLAIDLGGMGSGTSQHVSFDRLGLVDGQTYPLHIFYSQRHADSSVFRLRMSADVTTPAVATVSGAFD